MKLPSDARSQALIVLTFTKLPKNHEMMSQTKLLILNDFREHFIRSVSNAGSGMCKSKQIWLTRKSWIVM